MLALRKGDGDLAKVQVPSGEMARTTCCGRCRGFIHSVFFAVWLQGTMTAVHAVKLVNVDIPSPTTLGETVGLSCIYELNGDKLYSVKWYKNDIEFYRFVPNDWPPGQFLPLPGVDVDLARSGRTSVYLRNVNLHSAGTYRCEVSAEAPSFDTVGGQKDMIVLVLPTEGPRISGERVRYKVGDSVAVNCTSAKSKPAATLRWFINDVPVVDPSYETEYSTTLHSDGLETASLCLRFIVTREHFRDGNMKLKCTATISRVYTMSNEELVLGGGRHQKAGLHVSENTGRVRGSSGRSHPRTHRYLLGLFAVVYLSTTTLLS
ncbi:uncharacterized protein LOC135383663 [Ornithodoros turicata]|uniref:uncharacterized protein LOC135383663 n=1 Tax=Ornithodoros turicata TaxID=34597 RepID=UPI003139F0D6